MKAIREVKALEKIKSQANTKGMLEMRCKRGHQCILRLHAASNEWRSVRVVIKIVN